MLFDNHFGEKLGLLEWLPKAAAAAGFTLVASANTTGAAAGPYTTGAINTTGANLLVVVVSQYGNIAEGTLSDSKGNTWTGLTLKTGPGTVALSRIHYCVPSSVGSGHTFTYSSASNMFGEIAVMAWSGAAASPFDVENGGSTGSGTSLQPGSVTPSLNGSLLVAGVSITDGSSSYSIGSGFTVIANVPFSASVNEGLLAAYLVQGTAAAINPTFSWTGSAEAAATIAVFKPAGASHAGEIFGFPFGITKAS